MFRNRLFTSHKEPAVSVGMIGGRSDQEDADDQEKGERERARKREEKWDKDYINSYYFTSTLHHILYIWLHFF